MNSTGGTLHFEATLDTERLRLSFEQLRKQLREVGSATSEETTRMNSSFKKLDGYFSVSALRGFVGELIKVRGEVEQLDLVFETMLGSKRESDVLMSGLVDAAIKTPFDLKEIAGGAQQLLLYGLEAEKVNGTLFQLGNIASGLSIPLKELIDLYGSTQAQGKLMTADMHQFLGRGIDLASELAKTMGKSRQEVMAMTDAGISFRYVEQALVNMTSEGGRFFSLMDRQSASLNGSLQNLQDAYARMLSEMGGGVLGGAIDGAGALVENYEAIGKALAGLMAMYGVHKAVLISTAAVEQASRAISYQSLSELLTAEQAAKISKMNLTVGSAEYGAAVRSELMATVASIESKLTEAEVDLQALYVKRRAAAEAKVLAQAKVAQAREALAQAMMVAQAEMAAMQQKQLSLAIEEAGIAKKAQLLLLQQKHDTQQQLITARQNGDSAKRIMALNAEIAAINEKLIASRAETHQASLNVAAKQAAIATGTAGATNKGVEAASNRLNTMTTLENTAATNLNTVRKQTASGKILVLTLAKQAETLQTNVNTVSTQTNITWTNILAASKLAAARAATKLNEVLAANKFSLIAVAAIALGYGIYKMVTHMSDAEKATKRLDDAGKELAQSQETERLIIDSLFSRLKNTTKGTQEYYQAKEAISSKYGEYLKGLGAEIEGLRDVEGAYKAVSEAAMGSIMARAGEKALQEAGDVAGKAYADYGGKIRTLFVKEFGQLKGDELFGSLKKSVTENLDFTEEVKVALARFDQKHMMGVHQDVTVVVNPVKNWVTEIKEARGVFEDETKRINAVFGEVKAKDEKTGAFDPLSASLGQLRAEIPKVQDKIVALKEEIARIDEGDNESQKRIREAEEKIKVEEENLALIQASADKQIAGLTQIAAIKAEIAHIDEQVDLLPGGKNDAEYKRLMDQKKLLEGRLPGSDKQERGGGGVDAQKRLAEAILAAEVGLNRDRIAVMEDGKTKRLAESEREYEEQKAGIEKQRAELLAHYKEAGKKMPEDKQVVFDEQLVMAGTSKTRRDKGITDEYAKELADQYKQLGSVFVSEEERKAVAIRDRYAEQRKWAQDQVEGGSMDADVAVAFEAEVNRAEHMELYQALLGDLNDFKFQEASLNREWDAKISLAREQGDEALIQGMERAKAKELSGLHAQMVMQSDDWQQLFGELDTMTVREIDGLIAKIEAEMAKGNLQMNGVDLTEISNNLQRAKAKVIEINPFAQLGVSLKAVFKEGSKTSGASANDIKNNWTNLSVACEQSFGFINDALAGCEALREVIGESGMATISMIQNLAMAGVALGAAIKAATAGSIVLAAISLALTAVTAVFSLFSRDKGIQKKIEASEAAVKKLGWAFKDLERVIEKTLGEEKYKANAQMIENLRAQQLELARQQDLERQKKKSDGGKIDDMGRQIKEIDDQMADLLTKIKSDIVGGTAQDIASKLGDAFFEAFARGEDGLAAWGKAADEIIGSVIKKTLITKFLETKIGAEIDKFTESATGMNAKTDLAKKIADQKAIISNIASSYQSYTPAGIKAAELAKKSLAQYEAALEAMGNGGMNITAENTQGFKDGLSAIGATWNGIIESLDPVLQGFLQDTQEVKDGVSGQLQSAMTEGTASQLVGLWNMTALDIREVKLQGVQLLMHMQGYSGAISAIARDSVMIELNTRRTADNTQLLVPTLLKLDARLEGIERNTKVDGSRG